MSKNMLEALQGISGESESKNLVEAIDAVKEVIPTKSDISSVYQFKGSVANAEALPLTGQVNGDVYNIEAESTYGPAGMNVAWTGSGWDPLGSFKDVLPAVTSSDEGKILTVDNTGSWVAAAPTVEVDPTLSIENAAADAKTVGDEITDLKDDLTEVTEKSKNLMTTESKTRTVNNVNTSYSDGVLTFSGTANADGGRTLAVVGGWELGAGTYTFSTDNLGGLQIILQKSTGSVILTSLQGTTKVEHFTLSETTRVFIGIGVSTNTQYSGTAKLQIEKSETASDWVSPSAIYGVDLTARADIANIGGIEAIAPTWTSGKAFIYNAGWSNNSGWSYADIDLKQGQGVVVKIHATTTAYPLSVWSEDGNSIIKACFGLESEEADKEYTYICSAETEKVRLNVLNTYKNMVSVLKFSINDILNQSNIKAENNNYRFTDVLYNSIIAIGDSLTQGSYTGYDLHEQESYPAFLAKMMGVNVTNAGRAGWSTLEWFDGDATTQKGFPYYDFADYDTAVICLGTNGGFTDTVDDGATDTTNTGAYCSIIEGMRTQNPDINILLCNLWTSGGTGGVALANTVINKIATKYGLTVIDLQSEFRTVYGAYHAEQGNIHLGRIGYAKMAAIIRNALEKQVFINPVPYNFIPD